MKMKVLTVFLFIAVTCFIFAPAGAQQILYGADNTSMLFTIDPATGIATPISPMGFAQATGLVVSPTTGAMYATPGGGGCCPQPISGCLYSGNETTGAATQIGCDPVQGGNETRFPVFLFIQTEPCMVSDWHPMLPPVMVTCIWLQSIRQQGL